MVPVLDLQRKYDENSPRIRGDGPTLGNLRVRIIGFSPYSRGWSQRPQIGFLFLMILPVFAGMVPKVTLTRTSDGDSPRIRGDGP